MPSDGSDPLRPRRARSIGFLDRDGERWACFLVTWRAGAHRWKGHLLFRDSEGGRDVETAELFLGDSENEIDRRARSLGRPLLSALLDSALEVEARQAAESPPSLRWMRSLLSRNASEADDRGVVGLPSEVQLRSRYASYRIDQVGHLVALLAPEDFDAVVQRILGGLPMRFGMKDRLQFAMAVVEHLERLLPLPPYEVWRDDYLAATAEHERYSAQLREGAELP
ncbi:MAG: hypothetical protein R3E10_14475 [Gemmatimonadota bacterium]